jgi:hypothetical protein
MIFAAVMDMFCDFFPSDYAEKCKFAPFLCFRLARGDYPY